MPKGRPAGCASQRRLRKSHWLRGAPCSHPLRHTTHLTLKARQAARQFAASIGCDTEGKFQRRDGATGADYPARQSLSAVLARAVRAVSDPELQIPP